MKAHHDALCVHLIQEEMVAIQTGVTSLHVQLVVEMGQKQEHEIAAILLPVAMEETALNWDQSKKLKHAMISHAQVKSTIFQNWRLLHY